MSVMPTRYLEEDNKQEERHYRIKVRKGDHYYVDVDVDKRRIVTHLAATPTKSYFVKRWWMLVCEIAKLDMMADAPIDLVFDHTEATPIAPDLRHMVFTKTMGMAFEYINLYVWRVVPNLERGLLFKQLTEDLGVFMRSSRSSMKPFKTLEKAHYYLDRLRGEKPKGFYLKPPRR